MRNLDRIPGIYHLPLAKMNYTKKDGSNVELTGKIICRCLDKGFLLMLKEVDFAHYEVLRLYLSSVSDFKIVHYPGENKDITYS